MTRTVVFGPIASRRLGRSLGIDPIMGHICCQDCIYCEAGKTEILTAQRKAYVPTGDILKCLDEVLSSQPELDYITFSGTGEPTLSTGLGEIIRFIKTKYPQYAVCLLTNGMLLGDPEVRQEIQAADLVIPSLDASHPEEFQKINRPVADISFEKFVDGLADFTHVFPGKIWLELFIVPGINDSPESIARFAQIISRMRLNKIQLNALDRPGTEKEVLISSAENAARFSAALAPFAPVEFIGRKKSQNNF